jgi:predicted transcriptional regulator
MSMIEDEILKFVENERAVFLSDIAREFGISVQAAHDLAKRLQQEKKIELRDKGVAKLVISNWGVKE